MQELVESVFTGKWRSFKLFKHSGDIKLHTENSFDEFDFNADRQLTVKSYNSDNVDTIIQTDQWSVLFNNKRHYLNIVPSKLLYEVITVNHTVLVLADTTQRNKVFFTKQEFWQERLKSNRLIVL
jgi:hypothetical protein